MVSNKGKIGGRESSKRSPADAGGDGAN